MSNTRNEALLVMIIVFLGVAFLVGAFLVLVNPISIAIMVFGLLVCLGTLFDFRIGVILAVFAIPFSSTVFFPHQMFGITGANPLNAIMASTVIGIVFGYRKLNINIYELIPRQLVLYFILPCFVAALLGARHVSEIPSFMFLGDKLNFDSAGGYLRDILLRQMLPVIFGILVAFAVIKSEKPERILLPASFAAIILAAVIAFFVLKMGLGLGAMSGENARGVLSFTGLHANELGLMFSTCFALHLFSITSCQSGFQRVITLIGTICCAIIVALTFSRAAIAAMLFTVIFYLISRREFSVLMWGLIFLPFVVLFVPDAFLERLLTGFSGGGDASAISAGRLDKIWIPLIRTIPDNFIFGNGLSSVLWSKPLILGQMLPVGHAHNAYLNGLLDLGIVGFVLVILFYVFIFKEINKLRVDDTSPFFRQFFLGLKVALILLFVQGVTDDRFTPTRAQIYIWLGIGVLLGRRVIYSGNSTQNKLLAPSK